MAKWSAASSRERHQFGFNFADCPQSPDVKTVRFILSAALLALAAAARAEENRYDVLSRALLPFAQIFATNTKNPNRALLLSGRLELMTGLPAALVGSRAELALQYPDRMRLRAPVLGQEVTLCRRGQDAWVYPGAKVGALLGVARELKKLPKADPKARFESFALPVPEKQLALLPALFQVKDVGAEPLDGEPCRVLDLFLLPELARGLKEKDWAARLWVRGDSKPARLSVARTGWQIAVRFERVEFSKTLPPETWEPTAEQAGDVFRLDAARYEQLLGALVK